MSRGRIIVALASIGTIALLGGCGDNASESAPERTTAPAASTTTLPEATTSTTAAAPTTTVPVRPGDSPVEFVTAIVPTDGFVQPASVAVDSSAARVYVADSDNRRLVSFALDGTESEVIEADGAPFTFRLEGSLGAVDVDRDGTLWVAESGAKRLVHLTPSGHVISAIDIGPNLGRLFSVAVDRVRGLIYAVDDHRDEVIVFDRTGKELRRLASHGGEPGQVDDAGGIDVLADGTLWVADAGNARVQHLGADGSVIQVIGPFAEGQAGYMGYPNDVAVDAKGRIWVADYRGGAVVTFAPNGTPLARFGGTGDAYHPAEPTSLTFDAAGRLYVVERESDVVYVYSVLLP